MKEMNMKQLIKVTGGTVNDNYSPDAYTDNLDEILNGEKYDAFNSQLSARFGIKWNGVAGVDL